MLRAAVTVSLAKSEPEAAVPVPCERSTPIESAAVAKADRCNPKLRRTLGLLNFQLALEPTKHFER